MNELTVYQKYINSEDIVYDIGAYHGEMTNIFAVKAKKVYAFEPSKRNFGQLLLNATADNITCFNLALHEKEFKIQTKFKDCGGEDPAQDISYVILENFIKSRSIELPNFVKMDIEGMEGVVLNTCKFLFKSSRPIMYVEIHAAPRDSACQRYEHNPHFLYSEQGGFDFNLLKQYQYRYFHLNSGNLYFKELSAGDDYNPREGSFGGTLMIPQ